MGRPATAASVALTVVTVALSLTLSACASGAPMPESSSSASPAASGASRPPFQTTAPMPTGTGGAAAAVPPERWDAIVEDLAARGVTDPELVSAEEVVFNDSSLGCPSPGASYTQAQVDGMRVIVTADGHRYDYRFGSDQKPVLCTR